jgi:hypothetical protein
MQTPRVARAALARSAETRRDGSVAPNWSIRPPLALPSRPRRGARAIEERAAPIRREWRSGRQALAAARAAGVQNFTTADRFHARAKPMSAFANEFARLIGPLHGSNSKVYPQRDVGGLAHNKPTRTSPRRHFEPRSDPGKIQGDGIIARAGYRRPGFTKSNLDRRPPSRGREPYSSPASFSADRP